MNSTSKVVPLRRAISGLFAAGLAAGLLAAPPADARDRPGTPNNQRAWACGKHLSELPQICVEFDNTASERVTFEAEVTRNGHKFPPEALFSKAQCLTRPQHLPHACQASSALVGGRGSSTDYKTGERHDGHLSWEPAQGFLVNGVEPGVQYCFRFRARRVSDQVVSERWSNWACARGLDMPAKPLPPSKVSVRYMAETWVENVPLPGVVVTWSRVTNASHYRVSGYTVAHNEWQRNQRVAQWTKIYPNDKLADTIVVPPEMLVGGSSIEVCAHNVAGSACTRTVIDRLIDPAHHGLGTRTPAADGMRQILEKASQPKPAPIRPDVLLQSTETPKDLMRTQSGTAAASILREQPKVLQQSTGVPTPAVAPSVSAPQRGSRAASVFRPAPAAAASILREQPKLLQQSTGVQQPTPVPTPAVAPSVIAPQRGSLAASVFRPVPAARPLASDPPAGLRPLALTFYECKFGFVERAARPRDRVCVTPQSRARVANENATAGSRVNPGGGAYGPNTCRPGYVWREAFAGDLVCVEPQVRAAVREENLLASSRVLK